jgi:hypothetical protein
MGLHVEDFIHGAARGEHRAEAVQEIVSMKPRFDNAQQKRTDQQASAWTAALRRPNAGLPDAGFLRHRAEI